MIIQTISQNIKGIKINFQERTYTTDHYVGFMVESSKETDGERFSHKIRPINNAFESGENVLECEGNTEREFLLLGDEELLDFYTDFLHKNGFTNALNETMCFMHERIEKSFINNH